ncbi:tachykinin-4 isoform X1 [Rhinolophus ferrumequinum]|uniref:tachykinin-4 isoform X1 n=1 Tax=Rhinolophus ferrumequinum TaxID=59479 RepID=UPI00140F7473|nr:tachykinin-4 isoform X1 [Rhinolophus ferrumequinum]
MTTPKGSQHRAPTMLLCLTLLLLTGLSACTVAGDKEQALGTEAGSWVTVTLEKGVIPSVQLQLQEVKKGKVSQFFGLMGKQVGGIPPIQPERKMGKCYPNIPLGMLPGEGRVVLAMKSGRCGELWPGTNTPGWHCSGWSGHTLGFLVASLEEWSMYV